MKKKIETDRWPFRRVVQQLCAHYWRGRNKTRTEIKFQTFRPLMYRNVPSFLIEMYIGLLEIFRLTATLFVMSYEVLSTTFFC